MTDQEGGTHRNGVQVNLGSSKKLLLFHDWKPDLSDYIVKDFIINVPKGAAVTVDGVNLQAEYLQEGEYGNARYVIPQIFKGYYEVTVSKENMEDLTMLVDTSEGSCSADAMKLKPEAMQEAVTQAADDLKKIYKAAFQNKDESGLQGISILPESEEDVISNYLYLAQQIQSGRKLSLAVGEIQPEASYYNDDGTVYIHINLNYDYSELYEVTHWDGEVTNQSYNGNNTAAFVYLLDGSTLKLNSFQI